MPVARDCEVGGGNCHLRRALTSSLSAQSAYDEPSGALPDLLAPWRGGGGGKRGGEKEKREGEGGERGGGGGVEEGGGGREREKRRKEREN